MSRRLFVAAAAIVIDVFTSVTDMAGPVVLGADKGGRVIMSAGFEARFSVVDIKVPTVRTSLENDAFGLGLHQGRSGSARHSQCVVCSLRNSGL